MEDRKPPKSDSVEGDSSIESWSAEETATFEVDRKRRSELISEFLDYMHAAGDPGIKRAPGSTVRELFGRDSEHYWEVESGPGKVLVVMSDGRHGWADAMTYSDRPLSPAEEISPDDLEVALRELAKVNEVSWSPVTGGE
jgi:hypothetical protein